MIMANKNINHKLIPYFLGISVLFAGVFVVIRSFMESIADVWNMPEYGMFIVLNSLLSIVCTVVLFIGIISNKIFIKTLLACVGILLLFDSYIMFKQLFIDLDIKYFISMFFFIFLVHAYLIFMMVGKNQGNNGTP